jgi:mono/diheme cytochrome c family protein
VICITKNGHRLILFCVINYRDWFAHLKSITYGGKMLTTIIRKYKLGAIALLPLFLFAIPHSAAAQAGKAEEGQELFKQNCAKCHGPDGSGNTPIGKAVGAKDLRAPEALKMTDAEISTQIDKGKGNMPPFGDTLDKAKINDLIAYVRELGKKQTGAKKP